MKIIGYAVLHKTALKRHPRYGKLYKHAGVAQTYINGSRWTGTDYGVFPAWVDEPIYTA